MAIFELKDFVTGLEAEANRRLGVLSLLYNQRRMDPDHPGVSLLDRSLIVYGAGMGEGNTHAQENIPLVLAGAASGKLKGGRHLMNPENTPMSNLLLSILQKAGVAVDSVGDSTGPLAEL